MTPRKIIEVPCIVNSWLYISGVRNVWSGIRSCQRISRASRPPIRKNRKAEAPYMMPIRLWSTVVSQLLIPVDSWVWLIVRFPGSAVRAEVVDQGGDLRLGHRTGQLHQRPFLHGVRVPDPPRQVLVGVLEHPGHQVMA